jgi:hypothetical protein
MHRRKQTATGLLMPPIISSVMKEPSSMTKFRVVLRLEPARLRLAMGPAVKPRGDGQVYSKTHMKSALRIDILYISY